LEKAIQKEIGSRLLYDNLSQKMKDQVAKDAFQELARQEQVHQNLLEQYQKGELKTGTLSREQAVDYKIAEHLDQPEIFPDMQLKDVFLLAANCERHSHELYLAPGSILQEKLKECLRSWHHKNWSTSRE
ncbi:ferritin family protein, partial [Chloroflexota bacterium]